MVAQQRLIEADLAAQQATKGEAAVGEEEKKIEELSTSKKIGNRFVKFFKSDIGNLISAGLNGIAGPPVAIIGKVTDEITDFIDSDDDEKEA